MKLARVSRTAMLPKQPHSPNGEDTEVWEPFYSNEQAIRVTLKWSLVTHINKCLAEIKFIKSFFTFMDPFYHSF